MFFWSPVVEQRSCGTETLESAVQPDGGDTTREGRRCETRSTEPEARSLEPEVQSAREGVASHPLTANERERLESFYLLYEIADFIKKPDDRETLQRLDALCEIAEFRRKKS
nr:TPA_asm: MOZART [Larimichthys croaker adintovirus]